MTYRKGQSIPLERTHAILSERMASPRWHALQVRSGKEKFTAETLRANGCYAFYPKRSSSWFIRGKKHEREYPQIAGLIYAKFTHRPRWHAMRRRNLIIGVISIGERPVNIPSEIIRVLQGLPMRSEALAQARAEMQRVVAGDRARIKSGPLAGHYVQVEAVGDAVLWINNTFRGSCSQGDLIKDNQPSEADIQARADVIMGVG